jgi:hypothetical protein
MKISHHTTWEVKRLLTAIMIDLTPIMCDVHVTSGDLRSASHVTAKKIKCLFTAIMELDTHISHDAEEAKILYLLALQLVLLILLHVIL